MRKNFFKKLSFVLALAMIVSVIAPAAGVFADTGLKLNSKDKTLHLAQPGKKNKFNFNIDGEKQKGWKYLWISSNEDVAEVNEKNGVTTAVGTGTAEITVVITDKNGAEVDRLTAKVTVKDNIKTVSIKNAPTEPIPIGEEYDFDRSFVTYSGSTTKTTAVTRWSVEGDNKDKAAINDENGKFTASEAGTYTVVARSFQSKAKYNEWKKTGDASLVLDEASADVVVKATLVDVKQFDQTKFKAYFDSDVSKALTKDNATVYKVINGKDVSTAAEKIKEVKFEEDGKVAVVELYADFLQEQEYKFAYDGMSDSFKSAKVDLSLVTDIEFSDVVVNIEGDGKNLNDAVVGKNADGVIIYRGDSSTDFTNALSYEFVKNENIVKAWLAGNIVYIYENGYAVEVKAKFLHYYYNSDTNKVETASAEDIAIATGAKLNNVLIDSSLQFAVATSKPASYEDKWNVGPFKLAAGDQGYKIFARYKHQAQNPWDSPVEDESGRFNYEATDATKLIIQKSGNVTYVYPAKAGNVAVLVRDSWNNNVVVGGFEVAISDARGFANLVVESPMVTVSNHGEYGADYDTVTKIILQDTLGEAPNPDLVTVGKTIDGVSNRAELVNPSAHTNDNVPKVVGEKLTGNDTGKIAVKVYAKNATAKSYQFKLSVTYANTTKEAYIYVQVKEATKGDTTNAVRYDLYVSKNEDDLKEVDAAKSLTIKVVGYNKNGVKVAEAPVSAYSIKVEKGYEVFNTKKGSNEYTFEYVVSGTPYLTVKATGTYVITATVTEEGKTLFGKAKDSIIGRNYFTLKDSTALRYDVTPVQTIAQGKETEKAFELIKNAFKFYINNSDNVVVVSAVYAVGEGQKDTKKGENENVDVGRGTALIVKEVYVAATDGKVVYKFTPDVTITTR